MHGCINTCIVYTYNSSVFDVKICVAYINRYYIVDGYFYLLFLKNFFDNGIKKETDKSIQWDGVTEWDQNVQ